MSNAGGCTCSPATLQGHHWDRNSQTFLFDFFVSMAEDCVLAVTVMSETKSGGHKVKLMGVVVSDVAGVLPLNQRDNGALEYAGDVSMLGDGKAFDLSNAV